MVDTSSTAADAIAKLDQVIISLIQERERLVGIGRGMAIEADDSFNPPTPLRLPLSTQDMDGIRAFEHFGRGFWIGYEKDSGARISLRQSPKTDPFLSPPDHHYSLTVNVVDPGTAKWITIEWHIGRVQAIEPSLLTIGLKAAASRPEKTRFELSIPRVGAPQKRISLGTLELGTGMDFVSLSKRISRDDLEGADLSAPASMLLFLPIEKFELELAFLRVFLSPSGP